MDTNLIIATALSLVAAVLTSIRVFKFKSDIKKIKENKSKIKMQKKDGSSYYIRTNSNDPKEITRSVEKLLQH